MPGPNIFDPRFEDGERPEGFRSRRARIGYELGSELLGISVFELPPGEAAYPYHFHYPDSNKVGVGERLPHGGGLRAFFPADAAVGYWHGERRPEGTARDAAETPRPSA